jgi:hypothetical protein
MKTFSCWLVMVLASAIALSADTISDAGLSGWQSSSGNGISGDYSGWFYNSTGPIFPSQTDLSQPWTSASNIALMNSWLSLVTAAGQSDDPAALAALVGLGMNQSAVDSLLTSQSLSSSTQQAPSAPEPALLGLLGCGLALLCIYTAVHLRNRRAVFADRVAFADNEAACPVTKA